MTSLPQHVPRLIRGISTPGEISIVGVTGAAAAAAAAAVNTNMPLIGQGSCGKACHCTPAPPRRAWEQAGRPAPEQMLGATETIMIECSLKQVAPGARKVERRLLRRRGKFYRPAAAQ